jgi:hypothetical protein
MYVVETRKSSPTTLAGLDGVGATSQRLIPTAQRYSVADAHRGDGMGFVVRADELLTAFLELEAAIRVTQYQAEFIVLLTPSDFPRLLQSPVCSCASDSRRLASS